MLAPDLPAHGADATPLTERPYERYVPHVRGILDRLETPAILVGHSSGGMIISEVAARDPARVLALVYVSAFLLPPGKTPGDAMKVDDTSILRASLDVDASRGVSIVKPECARAVFYEDCGEEWAAWATRQLQPEPLIPSGPLRDFPTAAGSPPRFYVECLQDKALGLRAQRWMYKETPCSGVFSIASGHSPFLSAPKALAGCLTDIEARVRETRVKKLKRAKSSTVHPGMAPGI